jgi:CheY-like chemotaxis protein
MIETGTINLDEEYANRHASVSEGPHVMLAVTDTGVGMSADVQAHLFEPFFTTKELGKGTGLGLATTYGIVKQSGGHIWVYSEPSRGTTFKVYFPRAEMPVTTAVAELEVAGLSGRETILLVEDDRSIRTLTQRVLRRYGYTVLVASTAAEAQKLCREQIGTIDLLVSDVIMPDTNGPTLARLLLKDRPRLRVLFMSGYTNDAIAHHGILDSGAAFLEKPFTPDAIVRKVRTILDEPAAERGP